MQATIKTLTVKVDEKEVPLTKAMVNQFAYFEGRWTLEDFNTGQCKILGEVSLHDGVYILVQTPHGIQRDSKNFSLREVANQRRERIERLVLLK